MNRCPGVPGWTELESPYEVLGVTPFTSEAELRAAYQRRVRACSCSRAYQTSEGLDQVLQHHPDRPGGETLAFHRCQAAWEFLKVSVRMRLSTAAQH